VFSHTNPQRFPTAGLGYKVGLAALPLLLVTAWLGAAGCAGPQVYVPFEQRTAESAATRWQGLENLARRDQWKVVMTSKGFSMIAYRNSAGTSEVRDRIKVELFPDRTVVGTQTEIEDRGFWQDSEGRCEHYTFSREKLLAAQIEPNQQDAPGKSTELAAPEPALKSPVSQHSGSPTTIHVVAATRQM
jgi:hypothetical protein